MTSPDAITVTAQIHVKPGTAVLLKRALTEVAVLTRQEPGCLGYDLHQSVTDPNLFLLYEQWMSQADLDAHLQMPYMQDLNDQSHAVLAEPVRVKIWRIV
ncbi:MAG: putative quinol monooxygenase [Cyanobacteria bacterium J06642_9]